MSTMEQPLILSIDDPTAVGNQLLGGKFERLAEMTAAGFAVPPGFGITTAAYRHFLSAVGLVEQARQARIEASTANLARVQQLSAELAAAIEAAPMPPQLEHAIRESYAALERSVGEPALPVAVRSSGESEDLAGASFAGQYDTFLWVRGADEVLQHVRRCWAGLFGPAVLTYRPDAANPAEPIGDYGLCVGVQQMVQARSAGVLFTLDPVTGDRSKVVVEGCWGLGEGVVSGALTPSRYVVDKVTFEVVNREIAHQPTRYDFDPVTGEVGLVAVPEQRHDASCLTDDELASLARVAKRIEQHHGAAQDIEWAVTDSGAAHVLQVRPETVWSHKETQQLVGERKSAVDHVLARFAGVGIAPGRRRS